MEEQRKEVAIKIRSHIAELLPLLQRADKLGIKVDISEHINQRGSITVDNNGRRLERISVSVYRKEVSVTSY